VYPQKRRRAALQKSVPRGVCSLCAQDIFPGEQVWSRNGRTVCADCFVPFAREELRPFAYIFGEESVP